MFLKHFLNFFKIIELTPFIILGYLIGILLLAKKLKSKKGWIKFIYFFIYNIFCLSFAIGLMVINGRIVENKGKRFCKHIISNFKEEYIEKDFYFKIKDNLKIEELMDILKNENFKIEFYDFFGGIWEYEIRINNGKKYIFGIEEIPFPLFRLIFNPNFKLIKVLELD